MQYEFRGRNLQEAVNKAIRNKFSCKADQQRCQQLEMALQRRIDSLEEHEQDLEQVKWRISRLKDTLEDEAATASYDNASKIANTLGVIASIIPAARAVQTSIRAYRSASGVARAVAAGESVANAVASISVVSVLGLDFLKPSTKRQLEDAMNELERLTRLIDSRNRSIQIVLDRMHQEECTSIEV